MAAFIIKKASELSPDNSVYKCQGFSGTAEPSATTNIDFQFPQERWLTGGALIVQGGTWGDTCTIQVIDVDNVLGYGTNVVLREFVTNLVIMPGAGFQLKIEVPYVSLIPANVYLRLKYTNVGNSSTGVGCNLFTHCPIA